MAITKEFEQWVMQNLAPKHSQENPAFPNYTDLDIWLEGFKMGFEYAAYKELDKIYGQIEKYNNQIEKLSKKESVENQILEFANFVNCNPGYYEDAQGIMHHYDTIEKLYEIYKKYYKND